MPEMIHSLYLSHLQEFFRKQCQCWRIRTFLKPRTETSYHSMSYQNLVHCPSNLWSLLSRRDIHTIARSICCKQSDVVAIRWKGEENESSIKIKVESAMSANAVNGIGQMCGALRLGGPIWWLRFDVAWRSVLVAAFLVALMVLWQLTFSNL